MLSSQSL